MSFNGGFNVRPQNMLRDIRSYITQLIYLFACTKIEKDGVQN